MLEQIIPVKHGNYRITAILRHTGFGLYARQTPNYLGVLTAVVAYVDEESAYYRMTQETFNCQCTVNELLV